MSSEAKVAGHYGQGRLEEVILGAVAREGKDPENLTAGDLAAVDEFHVGGLEATQDLARQMELRAGMRLLDVGSGIGGPARYFAGEHGCKVTGIDLTEEFVRVAGNLTKRTKLDGLAEFQQGSALGMPFERGTFDGAYMIHVGMNIADKTGIFREVRRVVKAEAVFTIFDIMSTGDGRAGAGRAGAGARRCRRLDSRLCGSGDARRLGLSLRSGWRHGWPKVARRGWGCTC